ncbi:MAG: hypothetical protein EBX40_05060 [Gammaproteobacteria bacterium]|nr:hypothetical protein [Gammaproteobacteria bacterium]
MRIFLCALTGGLISFQAIAALKLPEPPAPPSIPAPETPPADKAPPHWTVTRLNLTSAEDLAKAWVFQLNQTVDTHLADEEVLKYQKANVPAFYRINDQNKAVIFIGPDLSVVRLKADLERMKIQSDAGIVAAFLPDQEHFPS